jgi:type 1 glutamine amidotransferase
VFSNTSGNNLFDAAQRANIEAYMADSGSILGIHAASDTYRNGSWPFYNQLVGAIVQSGPNHTSQNHVDTMDHIDAGHPVLTNLPDPWVKEEEYYYWDLNGGMINDDINELLRVRRTGPNSYDRERAITWSQEFDNGGRSVYTALGHKQSNYTDANNEFRLLIENAICWLAEDRTILSISEDLIDAVPASNYNTISWQVSKEMKSLDIKRATPSQDFISIANIQLDEFNRNDVYHDFEIDLDQNYLYILSFTSELNKITDSKIFIIERNDLSNDTKVFPNPAKNHIVLKAGESRAMNYKLIDINGAVLKSGSFYGSQVVTLEGIKKGLYLLELYDQNYKRETFKVIKE